MEKLTYALAGRAPDPFPYGKIKVFDLDTGQEVLNVIECDAEAGWLIGYRLNREGKPYVDPHNPEQCAKQRIEGRFEIVQRD